MSTREPLVINASIVAAVMAIVNMAVAFGWDLSIEQVGAINTAVGLTGAAVIVILTRGTVTPVDDPRGADGQPLVSTEEDY